MNLCYSLCIIVYLMIFCAGEMDEEIYRPDYGVYSTLPHISDYVLSDILEGKNKMSPYSEKYKWPIVDLDNFDKNKVFYVHRRRFTRPYGR
ncbi:unnamed protein product [Heterobilharzia americana]|nr:unnamed protein product [Heterobilharzia americana]CAH8478292.1 unnamed protein product [Heterobilharzia americana]